MKRKKAPDFSLYDQDGILHRVRDYRGNWLVVYFYPYDRSLNCTKEACSFRDEYRIIHQFGNAQIVGINHSSVTSHRRFAKRNHLNFPLLSDPGHIVTSAYGAWRSNRPRLVDRAFGTRRNTYLIDPEGFIAKEYLTVDPNDHAAEVIADLQQMQAVVQS